MARVLFNTTPCRGFGRLTVNVAKAYQAYQMTRQAWGAATGAPTLLSSATVQRSFVFAARRGWTAQKGTEHHALGIS
jgi:hypothetical protein